MAVKKSKKTKETAETSASSETAASSPVRKPTPKNTEAKTPLKEKKIDPRMSDPVFAELALPKLPQLEKRNRAWLQIQSPRRLFFYWSVKGNPFKTLGRAFGRSAENYSLAVKLRNLTRGSEEVHRVDAEGNWWFDAEPACDYRAEIGFFAFNRPFVRVIYSNTVETPRRSPSPRPASESEWAISSEAFARVLDRAGYVSDAFEVALRGDDEAVSFERTRLAMAQLLGTEVDLNEFDPEEVRHVLLMLAAGMTLDQLRGRISEALYLFLSAHLAKLSPKKSIKALRENFDIIDDGFFEIVEAGPAVFGASLLHMPSTRRTGRRKLRARDLTEFSGEGPSPISSKKF